MKTDYCPSVGVYFQGQGRDLCTEGKEMDGTLILAFGQ